MLESIIKSFRCYVPEDHIVLVHLPEQKRIKAVIKKKHFKHFFLENLLRHKLVFQVYLNIALKYFIA